MLFLPHSPSPPATSPHLSFILFSHPCLLLSLLSILLCAALLHLLHSSIILLHLATHVFSSLPPFFPIIISVSYTALTSFPSLLSIISYHLLIRTSAISPYYPFFFSYSVSLFHNPASSSSPKDTPPYSFLPAFLITPHHITAWYFLLIPITYSPIHSTSSSPLPSYPSFPIGTFPNAFQLPFFCIFLTLLSLSIFLLPVSLLSSSPFHLLLSFTCICLAV